MNILAWAAFIILCCIVLAVFTSLYVGLGKAALECMLELNLPDKWKSSVRTIVFILNPLFWVLFAVGCIFVLIGCFIQVLYDCLYDMTIGLKRNYNEIKELILK